MKYNFDEIIPRRGTNSLKWDTAGDDNTLPMWVADMDFRTAPEVIEALEKRAKHGIFGYVKAPETYYASIIGWFQRRHGLTIEKEWILYTTGVVPALSVIVKSLTAPGDKILIQTPVYNCFFSVVRNNGREIVTNSLIYENGTYRMDFDDLEKKAADPQVKLLLLCNPHNPAGRVWTRQELLRLGEICLRNNVRIIADEIHCELVAPGHKYLPFASLSGEFLQHSVTCTSPSKAFNLAGLQVANIFAADEETRNKINQTLKADELAALNSFAAESLIAAYDNGEEWLDELNRYIHDNYLYLKDFLHRHLSRLTALPLEGTYLAWIDCSATGQTSGEIAQTLLEKEKLWINPGSMYGTEGDNFIRLNIACPRTLLTEGLEKIKHCFSK
ncbi:MAG: pyridoxal phosphate-dependent aminotransferase [Odoribacter splanchnicus]|nr:pyridoxal phosphate-dependent aminotransferase [Odoribacter splanchnicus]